MTGDCPVQRHFTASAFVTFQGRVLLLLHATKDLWLPPGGHVEADEAPHVAAVREVLEETGLPVELCSAAVPEECATAAPRPEALLEILVEPLHVHLDLVFFARPTPGADPRSLVPNEEALELRWWSAQELRERAADPRLPADVVLLGLRALTAAEGTV